MFLLAAGAGVWASWPGRVLYYPVFSTIPAVTPSPLIPAESRRAQHLMMLEKLG